MGPARASSPDSGSWDFELTRAAITRTSQEVDGLCPRVAEQVTHDLTAGAVVVSATGLNLNAPISYGKVACFWHDLEPSITGPG